MKFTLSNCGVINETNIDCNGITLITGKNGSGKSTLVKCVVSLISTISSFENNISDDVKRFIYNKLSPYYKDVFMVFTNSFSLFFFDEKNRTLNEHGPAIDPNEKFPLGMKVLRQTIAFDNWHDSVEFLNDLLSEYEANISLLRESVSTELNKRHSERLLAHFEKSLYLIPETIKEMIDYLTSDRLLDKYIFESTRSLINYTFSSQLTPFSNPRAVPMISITNNDLYLSYEHNVRTQTNSLSMPFTLNSFYIDDGNIIDQIDARRVKKRTHKQFDLDPSFFSLKEQLLQCISLKSDIFSKIEITEKNKRLLDLINAVWPYNVSKRGGVTINQDSGLAISNEASGAKVFIILKLLLERGYLNENTLLIFDEPENHLHPEWQNKFAEIITHISMENRTKVICITHSPSLLLAFDVYSNILNYRKNFKCYFGDKEGRFSYFKDVTNNIEEAHDKMNEPYIWMDLQDK